ncbi:MAG: TIGR03757 family integrating conjugative element protein [Gammaproteobacteria bacterium]|nr:TIGR03757 family integrating conjugative element protein [Gammaproteobacteria bacterium]
MADGDSRLIEVLTDSHISVLTNGLSSTVYRVDRIDRLQQALSEGLPTDPKTAKQAALDRFQLMDSQLSSELENAAKGLIQAMQYGIDRYPAIVFDGKAVVYGVTDVKAANELYEQWRVEGEKQ